MARRGRSILNMRPQNMRPQGIVRTTAAQDLAIRDDSTITSAVFVECGTSLSKCGTSLSGAKGVVAALSTPFVPQSVPPNTRACHPIDEVAFELAAKESEWSHRHCVINHHLPPLFLRGLGRGRCDFLTLRTPQLD